MRQIWVVVMLILLGGCQLWGTALNGAHKIYTIVADDRSTADDLADMRINLEIRDTLARQKFALAIDIEVTVFEGEVLLTGAVPNIETMHTILTATWSVDGVKKIYNYVRLDSAPEMQNTATETVQAANIKAKLTATAGINSANYKIVLENGTVYLMGICAGEAEYQTVVAVLKDTASVSEIVPLMRMATSD